MPPTQVASNFDVAIIGGGSAGYAAARTVARAGLRVVVVEGGREVGGLCILRGCMPTKALLYAAEVHHLARHPDIFGIHPGKVTFDFAKVMARKNLLIKGFAEYRREQLTDGRFGFVRASAQFVDPHTIALDNGQTITAETFVISTGSTVARSPLPQLDSVGYLTSDSALTLERLPRSLIVLGGGSVALEFAQFFARFDVKVTLVQRSPHVLHDFDTDAAEVIETVFRREGIGVFTGTQLLNASRDSSSRTVTFLHGGEKHHVTAEEIFFALGRTPDTGALDLGKAGVETQFGRIVTDERMRTSAPHVYAAGDCTGPYEIVHIAVQQGEIAGHNIANPAEPRSAVVFTEPQLATGGLTEKEATARRIPFRAASYPFNDHGKSLIMNALDGFVKLLADPVTGEILGGACVGPLGGELIHEIIAAMHKRMTVRELAAMPHYHPTLAEIWTYPAEELAGQIG
ncbi:MAG: FAD-dependent oxidoreductase [Verrucomicrobia subdivision 3 bacterium]|nr:FAD-dependent oxidoreductase [Limisphaerales bacterium]